MLLENFRPQSKLVTKTTLVNKPKFPVIDAHNHLGEPFGGGWNQKPLRELLNLLDEAGVTHYVDLDGGWGEDILYAHLKHFKEGAGTIPNFRRCGLVEVAGDGGRLPRLGHA